MLYINPYSININSPDIFQKVYHDHLIERLDDGRTRNRQARLTVLKECYENTAGQNFYPRDCNIAYQHFLTSLSGGDWNCQCACSLGCEREEPNRSF
jgi:hypothetical protein